MFKFLFALRRRYLDAKFSLRQWWGHLKEQMGLHLLLIHPGKRLSALWTSETCVAPLQLPATCCTCGLGGPILYFSMHASEYVSLVVQILVSFLKGAHCGSWASLLQGVEVPALWTVM